MRTLSTISRILTLGSSRRWHASRTCVEICYELADCRPSELPPRRRRLSLNEEGLEEGTKYGDQLQTLFFTMLPPEVRRMIYFEILAGTTELRQILTREGEPPGFVIRNQPNDHNRLPFLQSCRRIYSEAVDMLYSCTAFTMTDANTHRSALSVLSSCIPSQHFRQIQDLSLDTFVQWTGYYSTPPDYRPSLDIDYKILGSMQLRRLVILVLEDEIWSSTRMDREGFTFDEADILKPLSELTASEIFEVHISWQERQHRMDVSNLPFRLFRRPAPPSATA